MNSRDTLLAAAQRLRVAGRAAEVVSRHTSLTRAADLLTAHAADLAIYGDRGTPTERAAVTFAQAVLGDTDGTD